MTDAADPIAMQGSPGSIEVVDPADNEVPTSIVVHMAGLLALSYIPHVRVSSVYLMVLNAPSSRVAQNLWQLTVMF
jgi:hypothetical protein